MKGFIPRTMLGLGLSLIALAGCAGYRPNRCRRQS